MMECRSYTTARPLINAVTLFYKHYLECDISYLGTFQVILSRLFFPKQEIYQPLSNHSAIEG